MLSEFIKVRPATALRRQFAIWAVAQTPKIQTVSTHEFAVPAALFAQAPEEVLIGALVDGHHYIPATDGEQGLPVLPEQQTVPGEALPPLPDASYGPDFAPLDDAPADDLPDPGPSEPAPEGVFPCSGCDREFTTARGLRMHRRQTHADSTEVS